MKHYAAILVFIISAISVNINLQGQEKEGSHSRKKVGLVLSGGGAKGFAHLGIIKAIEKAGIPVDYIAGTSMGAIAGGLVSVGFSAEELEKYVLAQNWTEILLDDVDRRNQLIAAREQQDLFMFSIPLERAGKFKLPSGLVAGENVINMLNELTLGFHDSLSFSKLPVEFACVAYDMVTGKEVVIKEGYLPQALRASMSIPGFFRPVKIGDKILIDGGIINNFPVDVVRAMGADIVIGVDLSEGIREREELNSVVDLIEQLTSFSGIANYEKNKADCDLYIHPEIVPYTSSSFSKEAVQELIRRGNVCGEENAEKLEALKNKIWENGQPVSFGGALGATVKNGRRLLYSDSSTVHIGKIIIYGVSEKAEKVIMRNLGILPNSNVKPEELRRAMNILRGTGAYNDVSYRLGSFAPHNLEIFAKEVNDKTLNAGVRFDTEEMTASLLLNTRVAFNGEINGAFNIRGRISKNPYVRFSTSLGKIFLGQMELSYLYKYSNFNLSENGDRLFNVQYGHNQLRLSVSTLGGKNFRNSFIVEYAKYSKQSNILDSLYAVPSAPPSDKYLNYYFISTYESLNDKYFPRQGVLFEGKYMLCTDDFIKYRGAGAPASASLRLMSAISINPVLTFLPSLNGRVVFGSIPAVYANYAGGEVYGRYTDQQIAFTGISGIQRFGKFFSSAGLDIRAELFSNNFLTLHGNYGVTAKDTDTFDDIKRLWGAGIGWSVNTIAGPIEFLIGKSSEGEAYVYLNIGKIF
jgi:NTE family protein